MPVRCPETARPQPLNGKPLLQKNLLVFLPLFCKALRIEMIHLDKLDLVRIRQRRIGPLPVYELTQLSHDVHALFFEEIIYKRLSCIGMKGLATEGHIAAVS